MIRKNIVALFVVLYFVLVTAVVLQWRAFPAEGGVVNPTDFSAERAAIHVRGISHAPHPVGVAAHDEVRDYITGAVMQSGCEAVVQSAMEMFPRATRNYGVAYLQNIVVRIPGRHNTTAVLVVGHYDSVRGSPGGADDGASVAAMLEMLRALKASPALKNDVIFLFTDGEEIGLLGAKAFVRQNALMNNVGIVFNFEARGSSGPSIMFETGHNNGWLIQRFARAAPYPYASSLTQALYNVLPNDTDFTVFRNAGYTGLNFAFAEDWSTYHSALDTSERLSMRSLQHHGSTGLALVREFGDAEPAKVETGDFIYFNLLGKTLVRYPAGWAIAISVLITIMFLTLLIYGLTKKLFGARGILVGALFAIASTVVAAVSTALLNRAMLSISPAYRNQADIQGSGLCVLGLVLSAIAISFFSYRWLSKRVSTASLSAGCLLVWVVLLWISTLRLPGSSYLFAFPLLFGTLSVMVAMTKPSKHETRDVVLLCILATPVLIVAVPAIQLMSTAFTLPGAFLVAAFATLLTASLLPQLGLVSELASLRISGAVLGTAAVGLMISGVVVSNVKAQFKEANHILYVDNFDKQSAFWMTEEFPVDPWTSQFFTPGLQKAQISNYLPAWYSPVEASSALFSQAPPADLTMPAVSIVSDNDNADDRKLSLRVQSPGSAPLMIVRVDSQSPITRAELSGNNLGTVAAEDFSNRASQIPPRIQRLVTIRLYAPPKEGSILTVHTAARAKVTVSVVEIYYDIPAILQPRIHPRLPTMMPSRSGGDGVVATRTFSF